MDRLDGDMMEDESDESSEGDEGEDDDMVSIPGMFRLTLSKLDRFADEMMDQVVSYPRIL